MRERPGDVSDEQVLAVVRARWDGSVVEVEHLPVGFGAWHWRASGPEGARLFVTLDPPLWHDAASLESAYRGAAELGRDLAFVHAPLVSAAGTLTVPLGDGWLSCTPWVDGAAPDRFGAEAAEAVGRLHAAEPPAGLPVWTPLVRPDLLEELRAWTADPWTAGPLGEPARELVRGRLADLEPALTAYLVLRERLDPDRYVPTHGEPDVHNQRRAADGRLLLLDWETLKLAPRERDLLGGAGRAVAGDPALVSLFRLEWTLSEVRSYSAWLRGPHRDDGDTRIALGALGEEVDVAAMMGV